MSEENDKKLSDTKKKTEREELQRERALMNKLVAGRDLNKEEDVDQIYELMLKYKGRMFCSPLGEKFVRVIQCRTSVYRKNEKTCKRLNIVAVICAGIAILTLIPIVYLYLGMIQK